MSFWINILSTEVTDICKSASLAIRNIGKIRNYLDQPIAEKLVHAFVTSKIDFCNSLLYGLSKKQLDKLQHILNAAARINKKSQNFQHISSVLLNLHWLPVTKRIEFKILTITHKALNGMALSYICDLPQVHHPNRNLRSASRSQSIFGSTYSSDTGVRCSLFLCSCTYSLEFLVSTDIKRAQTFSLLKRKLKTFFIQSILIQFVYLLYFVSYICKVH